MQQSELIEKQAKKGGFRGRINAKCIECIYDPTSSGSWRKQVEECTSLTCPLHEIRPVSGNNEKKEK
jgi:hypothetical protein